MKIVNYLLFTLEMLVLFVCSYLTIVLIGLIISVNNDYNKDVGEIDMYVASNGIHTDICLPVTSYGVDWTEFISTNSFNGIKKRPKYISIGWGDKGFFLDTPEWGDLTFETAFNAAFLPSPTAMHVAYKNECPIENEKVKYCPITKIKFLLLVDFIKTSFQLQNNQSPIIIEGKGYTEFDNFYEAKGNYHLFRTCNTWTNKALSIAGVKTSALALFEKGILRHL